MLKKLMERRAAIKAALTALNEATVAENGEVRNFTDVEQAEYDTQITELETLDERISQLQDVETREAAAAAFHLETGTAEQEQRATVTQEPNPVYRRDDISVSYFRDLAMSQLNIGNPTEARERLARSQETRAGDMTTVAGAGGEFAPPVWLISDFVALARGGRVSADLMNKQTLPSGVSSINLPKVASGTSVAVQQTQNSALSDTAMTTTSVSSGITTVGGKQIISMQLLQQSGIPFDRVVLQDLAAEYAVQVDKQVLYGTNANGQLRGLVGTATNNAFTTASPAPASVTNANSLYYVTQKAAAALQRALFKPADAIIMTPERWAWILGSVDANSRPFVVPTGNDFNPLGTTGEQVAQGQAGYFGSYAVYTDPNVSQTANSATNQDEIYVLRRDEHWLYESPVQTESFTATYADNASVLFRVLGYLAFIPHRRSGSVQSIRGTGLIVP